MLDDPGAGAAQHVRREVVVRRAARGTRDRARRSRRTSRGTSAPQRSTARCGPARAEASARAGAPVARACEQRREQVLREVEPVRHVADLLVALGGGLQRRRTRARARPRAGPCPPPNSHVGTFHHALNLELQERNRLPRSGREAVRAFLQQGGHMGPYRPAAAPP